MFLFGLLNYCVQTNLTLATCYSFDSNGQNDTFQSVSVLLPSTYLCRYTICYRVGCFRSSSLAFSRLLLELFIPLSLVLFPFSSLAKREHAQNVIGFPLACVTSRLHPMGLSNMSRSPTLGNYKTYDLFLETLIFLFFHDIFFRFVCSFFRFRFWAL